MADEVKFFQVDPSPFDAEEARRAEEDYKNVCRCKDPVGVLEIDCGAVLFTCDLCQKPLSDEASEILCMAPVKVRLYWDPGHCTCNMMNQLSCDCDQWLMAEPVAQEGEG